MLNIRKVLFPTDFSECSNRALPQAVRIAQQYGSELHVLHAVVLYGDEEGSPNDLIPDRSAIERILEELALERLGTLVEEQNASTLVLKQVHRRGISAAPLIVEYAREEAIDLIVMGTHGRRGVRKLLLGSVATEVMRMAPCSVLTVRGRGDGVSSTNIRRILVPIDFSKPGEEALAVACEVASTYGAELQMVHILPEIPSPPFYDLGGFSSPGRQPGIVENTESALEDLLEERCASRGAPAGYHVLEGNPAATITRFAHDHNSDLIIMATHGLTGIMHFLMGSTTEKVLAGAECPVMVVKASGRSLLQ
jgi:nucleotide-binding universal stress UspA family protein